MKRNGRAEAHDTAGGSAARTVSRAVQPTRRRATRTPRQEQILEELEAIFLAEGFRHLTLQDLTSELHCSRTILYAVAPTKEELALVVIDRYLRNMGLAMAEAEANCTTPRDRLAAALDAIEARARPASPQFFSDIAAYGPAHDLHMRHSAAAVAHIRDIILDGRNDGSFHEIDALFAAEVVNLVISKISDGTIPERTKMSTADAVVQLKSMMFDGLIVDSGARPRGGRR